MADDANNPVLRDRTAGPVLADFLLEPEMCGIVTDMSGNDKRDQNIHVEQEGHGASSRSALTTPRVTSASLRGVRRGTPLRSPVLTGRRSTRRARPEIRSPTATGRAHAGPTVT